jgi:hypothetical protein
MMADPGPGGRSLALTYNLGNATGWRGFSCALIGDQSRRPREPKCRN